MHSNLSRRRWLRHALTTGAGLGLFPAVAAQLAAKPISKAEHDFFGGQQKPGAKVRLNANENPYGPSSAARKAIVDSLSEANRYAFAELGELRKQIAKKEGVSPDFIMLGAGSGDLLCQTGVAYGLKGGSILSAYPTFPLLMNYAEGIGARWDKVDLTDDLVHDFDAMMGAIKSDTQMVFICNPNNPTGTAVDGEVVVNFCREAAKRTLVYADEAYIEFLEPSSQKSMTAYLDTIPNLIVSKTFSKVYGLAGLRIGYIVAHPDILSFIGKYGDSISPSQTALAAARVSLGDESFMKLTRDQNAKARKVLTDYLAKKGWLIGESLTNVVFFPAPAAGSKILKGLDEKGYLIRVWEYKGREWCRVSIGTEEQMKGFVKSFDEVIS